MDELGNFQRIELCTDGKTTLCPDKPFKLKGFTGNYSAQFLADYALVVLYGPGLSKDKDEKYTAKHQNYVNQVKLGNEAGIELLKPITLFLEKYDSNKEFRDNILMGLQDESVKLSTDILSFRVGIRNVETDPSCIDYYQKMAGLSVEKDNHPGGYYSAVTGKQISPITGTFPMWKGGKAGSGVPIFASSLRGPGDLPKAASKSFGAQIDCPMSEEEANIIMSGLDYILNEADQYNPDFGICWWYDSEIQNDVIKKTVSRWQKWEDKKNSSKDPSLAISKKMIQAKRRGEDYRDLLLAVKSGYEPLTLNQTDYKYHIVGISFPSKGRMLFENEYSDTYQSLNQHLIEWYEDSLLTISFYDLDAKEYKYHDKKIKNIYEILYALKFNSKDGGKDGKYSMFHKEKYQLLKAVYTGAQIPERFFRIATEQYC